MVALAPSIVLEKACAREEHATATLVNQYQKVGHNNHLFYDLGYSGVFCEETTCPVPKNLIIE